MMGITLLPSERPAARISRAGLIREVGKGRKACRTPTIRGRWCFLVRAWCQMYHARRTSLPKAGLNGYILASLSPPLRGEGYRRRGESETRQGCCRQAGRGKMRVARQQAACGRSTLKVIGGQDQRHQNQSQPGSRSPPRVNGSREGVPLEANWGRRYPRHSRQSPAGVRRMLGSGTVLFVHERSQHRTDIPQSRRREARPGIVPPVYTTPARPRA
ncbi:hypothetical protein B0T11DRAFT_59498 [Plectosphaerella cucumerina]|uniref:Uncharacterized protein n=1 Tax=Plectosphaerella cucumerina TaxID=40658 RepID=A0A8K0X6X1_9PEZI|nr:hypothetical protein B0T11DRAFT_59498 [Plectosphaerella cucumerina]